MQILTSPCISAHARAVENQSDIRIVITRVPSPCIGWTHSPLTLWPTLPKRSNRNAQPSEGQVFLPIKCLIILAFPNFKRPQN